KREPCRGGNNSSRFTAFSSHTVRQFAALALLDQLVNLLGRQVLVVVKPDLHHRRGAAGAEALDLGERELPVFGRLARLDAQASRAVLGDFVRAEDLARERLANL